MIGAVAAAAGARESGRRVAAETESFLVELAAKAAPEVRAASAAATVVATEAASKALDAAGLVLCLTCAARVEQGAHSATADAAREAEEAVAQAVERERQRQRQDTHLALASRRASRARMVAGGVPRIAMHSAWDRSACLALPIPSPTPGWGMSLDGRARPAASGDASQESIPSRAWEWVRAPLAVLVPKDDACARRLRCSCSRPGMMCARAACGTRAFIHTRAGVTTRCRPVGYTRARADCE